MEAIAMCQSVSQSKKRAAVERRSNGGIFDDEKLWQASSIN